MPLNQKKYFKICIIEDEKEVDAMLPFCHTKEEAEAYVAEIKSIPHELNTVFTIKEVINSLESLKYE